MSAMEIGAAPFPPAMEVGVDPFPRAMEVGAGSFSSACNRSKACSPTRGAIDGRRQPSGFDWLHHVLVEPGGKATFPVLEPTVPGKGDESSMVVGLGAELPRHLVPVEQRQAEIDEGEIGADRGRHLN